MYGVLDVTSTRRGFGTKAELQSAYVNKAGCPSVRMHGSCVPVKHRDTVKVDLPTCIALSICIYARYAYFQPSKCECSFSMLSIKRYF